MTISEIYYKTGKKPSWNKVGSIVVKCGVLYGATNLSYVINNVDAGIIPAACYVAFAFSGCTRLNQKYKYGKIITIYKNNKIIASSDLNVIVVKNDETIDSSCTFDVQIYGTKENY